MLDILFNMLPIPVLSIDELKTISYSFFDELKNAYEGKKSSLPFLIHELPQSLHVEDNARIQIMVFGGTVFKTNIFQKKSDNLIQMNEDIEKKTPLFIDKDTFVHFIVNELQKNIQYLAINFAYPIKPILHNNFLDGILLRGTKESVFSGLIGESVGITIQKAIFEKTQISIPVTVANDAICLLLSEANEHNWDEIVGGIVGTGTNYALTLPNRRIVNLECGNFNNFPLSEAGSQVDNESLNKGAQLIEKEIAGAYLYKHYNYYNKRDDINTPLLSSTYQLSEIAKNSEHIGSRIARSILERSASLAAAQMAGISMFKKTMGINKLLFVMEGNLFWHGWGYKKNVERYLDAFGLHDNIFFEKNEHHSVKGTLRLLTF